MSDTGVAVGIFSVFMLLALIMPFVNSAFGSSTAELQSEGLESGAGQSDVSAIDVFASIFKMFFWSFGTFPFWLEGILSIFRITLAWLVVRVIRGVGG